MPNRDGTGPEGKGPRTGRQLGDCEGARPVVDADGAPVRGRGLGRGLGRGARSGQGRRARQN
jgi:hypothetical protein